MYKMTASTEHAAQNPKIVWSFNMYKSFLFAAAVSLGSLTAFATPSFAEQSRALLASSDGISLGTTQDLDSKYPVTPETGKRAGVLDGNGMGRDTSQQPDGPRHDPATCGICK